MFSAIEEAKRRAYQSYFFLSLDTVYIEITDSKRRRRSDLTRIADIKTGCIVVSHFIKTQSNQNTNSISSHALLNLRYNGFPFDRQGDDILLIISLIVKKLVK